MFGILAASWLALYQFLGVNSGFATSFSLLQQLWDLYGNPAADLEYAKLIPLAIIMLLWHKRDRLAAAGPGPRWPGVFLMGLALLAHLAGFSSQQSTLSTLALFAGIYSLMGIVWGAGVMREAFFPFFLLFFCVPLGSIMDDGTFKLRLLATRLTFFVSHTVLGVPLAIDGTTLTTPGGRAFEVIAACSGLRSFTALLVVTIIYAMTGLTRLWKRVFIVGVTVPLAIGCNVLRLSAMVVAHRAFGPRAGKFVHDTDWIITYGVAIAVIMVLGHLLREKDTPPQEENPATGEVIESCSA